MDCALCPCRDAAEDREGEAAAAEAEEEALDISPGRSVLYRLWCQMSSGFVFGFMAWSILSMEQGREHSRNCTHDDVPRDGSCDRVCPELIVPAFTTIPRPRAAHLVHVACT